MILTNQKLNLCLEIIAKNFIIIDIFKKVLFNEINNNKAGFYRISLKNGKLQTILQLKDDINNFNDKRHMINNLISKPHEINL